MKLKNYLLILTTLCIAFYSCKVEEEEPEPEKTLTLLPLHINNEWVMIDSISPYPTGDVVVSVTKIKYPYSYISYPVNGFSANALSGYGPFPIIESDKFGNIVTYLLNFGNLYDKTIIYKWYAGKGDKWSIKSYVWDEGDVRYEVYDSEMTCLGSGIMIQTPKGNFRCSGFTFSSDDGEDTFVDYLCEGVGWVQRLHYKGDHLYRKRILKDYRVKK